MADLRIVDAPEIPTENITGEEKLPTGGSGNYSITLDSLADYTKTKKDLADNSSVNSKVNGVRQELDAHIEDLLNPHKVTKGQIGLGNVDNTADADKPVSNSTQAAIITATQNKADKSYVDNKTHNSLVDRNSSGAHTSQSISFDSSDVYTKLKQNIPPEYDQSYAISIGGYPLHARIMLDSGYIVKNTLNGNTVNPNSNLIGWVREDSTGQILDVSGKTQKEINDFTSEKTLNLIDFFTKAELVSYRNNYTSIDIYAAWNRATTAANNLNQRLTAFGSFRSASTLILNCSADLGDMILESSAADIALDIRSNDYSYLKFKTISTPQVVNLNKVYGDNWVSTNATGVRIVNTDRCFIDVIRIQDFAVGLHEWATDGKGNSYNTLKIGQLHNNKINHLINADNTVVSGGGGGGAESSSWTNQNVHIGGSYTHFQIEGDNVPNCHHIFIMACAFTVNGHAFYSPSFENKVCDYHVVNGGTHNLIEFARWETQGTTPKVKYYCDDTLDTKASHGNRNIIREGYDANLIVFTKVGAGSAFLNELFTKDRVIHNISTNTGGHKYTNKYSNNEPFLTVYDAAANLDSVAKSEYVYALGARKFESKKIGESFNWFETDAVNKVLKIGDGTSTDAVNITGNSNALFVGKSIIPTSTASNYNLGLPSNKYKDVHLTGAVGFFGSTPLSAKPTISSKKVPTTITEQNATIDNIISVLVAYGIITDSRT